MSDCYFKLCSMVCTSLMAIVILLQCTLMLSMADSVIYSLYCHRKFGLGEFVPGGPNSPPRLDGVFDL